MKLDPYDKINELLALFSMRISEIESLAEICTRVCKDVNDKVHGYVIIYPKKAGDGHYIISVNPEKCRISYMNAQHKSDGEHTISRDVCKQLIGLIKQFTKGGK